MSTIDPKKLHPNPANTIFDPLPEDIYQAFKDDIAQRGLLNPILVTPDFIIIAGHHRLKAAVELGFESVPIEIQNVDADEAENRKIADNVLRRQLNPMEQARLIKRLKERVGIKPGNPHGVNSVKFTELTPAAGLKPESPEDSHLLALFAERINAVLGPVAAALQETFRHTVPGLTAGEDPQWTGFPDEKNREGGKSDDDPGDKA